MSQKKDSSGTRTGAGLDGPEVARRQLNGRMILVTRARAQSLEITSLFEALGAGVTHMPSIEIIGPASWEALDDASERLETYDWLVFTSPNAARFFYGRMKDRSVVASPASPRPRICAIGPETAKAVEEAGAKIDLVPEESRAEGALNSLIECLGGRERLRGVKFLIPQSQIARKELPAGLAKLGAVVEAIEAYRTVKPEADCETVRRQLRERAIHAITFTSPSTIANFAGLLGVADLSDLVGPILAGCIGPTTAAAAKEFGLQRIVQPERYNVSALVEVMARSLTSEH